MKTDPPLTAPSRVLSTIKILLRLIFTQPQEVHYITCEDLRRNLDNCIEKLILMQNLKVHTVFCITDFSLTCFEDALVFKNNRFQVQYFVGALKCSAVNDGHCLPSVGMSASRNHTPGKGHCSDSNFSISGATCRHCSPRCWAPPAEVLTPQLWGGICGLMLLTHDQVMEKLDVQGSHFLRIAVG